MKLLTYILLFQGIAAIQTMLVASEASSKINYDDVDKT